MIQKIMGLVLAAALAYASYSVIQRRPAHLEPSKPAPSYASLYVIK